MAASGQNIHLLSIVANNTQHDAVLDYYGRRLATCSSDKTIKIFEVEGENHKLVETLKGYVIRDGRPCNMLTAGQTRRRRLVRRMGTPQVWQHPRLFVLRRQSPHLARTIRRLAKNLRRRPSHRIREPCRLGTPRGGLSSCMRFIRWQRLGPRIQRQRLDAPDLPGLWLRREQCLVGSCYCSRASHQCEREPSRRCETICYWRK